jgi:hypothetical protein
MAVLLTGTDVPPDDFTLLPGDEWQSRSRGLGPSKTCGAG